ncbi:MAG TPA: hypothetical protein VGH19_09590 [Verrucomicrobiae bacterium]
MKIINLLLLIGALIISGCATGKKFDVSKTQNIKRGETVPTQLTEWFGKPWTVREKKDGTQEYIWQYTRGTIGGLVEQQELRVYVDPDGKVKDFTLKQI